MDVPLNVPVRLEMKNDICIFPARREWPLAENTGTGEYRDTIRINS
jgi:hypothetical protein